MSPLDLQRMAVRSPQLANNLATRLGSSRMSVPPSGMPAVNRPPASLPVRPPSTMYPPPSYGPSQREKAKQDEMMSRRPVYGPTPQEKAKQDEMMRIQPVGPMMPYPGDLQTALNTQQQMLPYTADLQSALNAQQNYEQSLNQLQGALNPLYSSPSSGPNPTMPYDPYEYERMLNDQRAAAANMPGTVAGLQSLTQQMAGQQQAGGGAQYSGTQTTLPSTLNSMTNSLSANQAALAQSANSVNSGIGALPYGSNLTRMG